MITSSQNERIKYTRSLRRRRTRQQEGRFVTEGTRLVGEAVRAGIKPAFALYTNDWAATTAGQILLPALSRSDEGSWLVSDAVLAACSDTSSPQGVLLVVPFVQLEPQPGLLLILDQVRDPGNLGTILRSATAANVGQVLLTPGTVDVYSPKVVRAAMGAHFHLPVFSLPWPAIVERLDRREVWLADAAGEVTYDRVNWVKHSALIVGGEASGAGEQAAAHATGRVSIPMAGKVESLNAAMAATVILFEAARQRQAKNIGEQP
jgi:TrmH family RNA methyltransferase